MGRRVNPPIPGHTLLYEGARVSYGYRHPLEYGCECGARPTEVLGVNATKRWHREHKAQIRAEHGD